MTKHAAFAAKYPEGEAWKKACEELQRKMKAGQSKLLAWSNKGGSLNSATFAGTFHIIREGKPFMDGEYVKRCMLNIGKELFEEFPNKDKILQQIKDRPLSAKTVHDQAVKMADQVDKQQIENMSSATYFSFALDESTDICDVAQLCILGRYICGNLVHEEMLAILPMKKQTRGKDILKTVMDFVSKKQIQLGKLVSVCTDGAPSMTGKHKGFVALLSEQQKRPILSFHCIVHQEALCAQSCGVKLSDIMALVVRIVNWILARALNHCQFQSLLEEVDYEYPGLLMHNNVRWLSCGKILARFAACLKEIKTFLEMKGVTHPELSNCDWLLKFYHLVDITGHLNQLNVKLQGQGNTILSLQQAVFAFESKLNLFIRDIETGRLTHFETLRMF
nr:PREDICTED: general transcription factor II-I repeat domain-containing protein 2-like [Latimeria chalumnae]|eukprot:XP_014351068.1 PREDICTED: general transcription factor II-I repeat domain-containing protein 2-like [Latimeria chalumnae]